ncbi:MAG: transcription termination factor Rho, partial [Nitrososphaerota archaeon]
NLAVASSGRTLSGGLDPAAITPPRRFIGAARNVEEGGSLTIIATVLVDTNSRMDDVIYEEFKGTGNMEITLDRKLSERRIFPAIDITRTSTRREELLLDENALRAVVVMRRMFATLAEQRGIEAMEAMMAQMAKTQNNEEFLANITKSIQSS